MSIERLELLRTGSDEVQEVFHGFRTDDDPISALIVTRPETKLSQLINEKQHILSRERICAQLNLRRIPFQIPEHPIAYIPLPQRNRIEADVQRHTFLSFRVKPPSPIGKLSVMSGLVYPDYNNSAFSHVLIADHVA